MNFSNQILNSSLMILILNQFLRTIYLNIDQKYYIQIILIGLLLLIFIIIGYALLRRVQLNSKLMKIIILIFYSISQFEQFYYGIDNLMHCVLAIQFYLEIYFNGTEKSKLSQIIAIFLLFTMIILSSINLELDKILTLNNIIRLLNQKINLALFVFFFYCLFQNQTEYKQLDQQAQRKSKQITLDQVLVLQTPINNSMYELSHGMDVNIGSRELFDNINEGVLLAKYISPDDKIASLSFKFQNAAAQIMFGKDNDELPAFLDTLQCDIQLESSQSQGMMTSSPPKNNKMDYHKQLFVSQSNCGFSLQERKSFSPNSKIGFFNQNQNSDSVVQCKTIYQQILYFVKQKKNSSESDEIQEQIKLQSTFEDNGKQKSIEFIILQGQGKQIFIITRDVIYVKQLKELLQVNQQKSNMLNYVSHEFRTPLNCIINILQSVQNKVLQNQDQLLKIALESSQHLLNLANDLLDLAQIKNNVFNITIRQFNLCQLAEECQNSFLIQAQQQNVQISVKTNSNKTFFLSSDRNRIKQILINLIGNALKFTYDGKIEIILRQYDQFIDIGVKDTGIGISQENIHKLFKAFSRIDNEKSKSMNSNGVGLGLLISNKIAKQLSADGQGIKVQSTEMKYENHGSFFYFTVKIETHRQQKLLSYKPPQKQLNLSSPFIPSEGTQKKKSYTFTSIEQRLSAEQIIENKCLHLLIVDDNVFNLAILQMMINDYFNSQDHTYQYTVDKANSGTQAVGIAFYTCGEDCQGYSLIFMDMEMPGLNGIDASKIILAKNSDLKIIILTGNNLNQSEINELKKIGIIDYIIKPIKKQQLENLIEQHVIE